MEIKIQKSELNRVLYAVQSIVEKRHTMPILVNVLLSAGDGTLKASATDLEITVVSKANAQVVKPGSTTANAKVLYEVVKELPDDEVVLKVTDGERLEIGAGKSKTRIIGVSAEEYPGLPGVALEVNGRILSDQLSEMVSKTIYAVSQDETRFSLTGVCFELSEGGKSKSLKMVATDGHRLAMITRPVENLKLNGSVIVPRKGLAEVKKIIEGENRLIGIEFREGFLLVETSNTKLAVRLIDGEFPDYKQVMPKQKGAVAVVGSNEFAQALKRVALIVTDKSKGVRLDFAKDSLAISSSSPELGDARESITATFSGAPVSVGFNARYLLDIAASLPEATQIQMEINGELGAGKFYPEGDDSYTAIVMPMRLVSEYQG